jgi:inositol transport system substrate-binding protein
MGRREAWQKEFFDKRKDVKIIDEKIANWNKDEGMQLTEDWIQSHPKIDAVISMNDNMAAGAIEAIKGSGAKTYPLIYGVDGTAEACLLIKDGKMTSTTLQNANTLAEKSLKLAHEMLTDDPKELHDTIQAELITKDNVDKYIDLHKQLGDIK